MAEDIGLFDAIYTTRSIRRFKPEPVPDDVLRKVLEAAVQAPSGGNRQPWTWLVIRSPEGKKRLHELVLEGRRKEEAAAAGGPMPPNTFADALPHVGAVVLVCTPQGGSNPRSVGPAGAAYPAIQNLLLAARAFDLGGVITLGHRWNEDAIKAELGIPGDQVIVALVPLGYPERIDGQRHGKKTRKPVEETAFAERWGQAIGI